MTFSSVSIVDFKQVNVCYGKILMIKCIKFFLKTDKGSKLEIGLFNEQETMIIELLSVEIEKFVH